MARIDDISIGISLNVKSLKDDVSEAVKTIKSIDLKERTIPVKVDTAGVFRAIGDIRERLVTLTGHTWVIPVTLTWDWDEKGPPPVGGGGMVSGRAGAATRGAAVATPVTVATPATTTPRASSTPRAARSATVASAATATNVTPAATPVAATPGRTVLPPAVRPYEPPAPAPGQRLVQRTPPSPETRQADARKALFSRNAAMRNMLQLVEDRDWPTLNKTFGPMGDTLKAYSAPGMSPQSKMASKNELYATLAAAAGLSVADFKRQIAAKDQPNDWAVMLRDLGLAGGGRTGGRPQRRGGGGRSNPSDILGPGFNTYFALPKDDPDRMASMLARRDFVDPRMSRGRQLFDANQVLQPWRGVTDQIGSKSTGFARLVRGPDEMFEKNANGGIVGANNGLLTKTLRSAFPKALIEGFEGAGIPEKTQERMMTTADKFASSFPFARTTLGLLTHTNNSLLYSDPDYATTPDNLYGGVTYQGRHMLEPHRMVLNTGVLERPKPFEHKDGEWVRDSGDVLAHELGHVVSNAHFGHGKSAGISYGSRLRGKPITTYSEGSPEEHWAELFGITGNRGGNPLSLDDYLVHHAMRLDQEIARVLGPNTPGLTRVEPNWSSSKLNQYKVEMLQGRAAAAQQGHYAVPSLTDILAQKGVRMAGGGYTSPWVRRAQEAQQQSGWNQRAGGSWGEGWDSELPAAPRVFTHSDPIVQKLMAMANQGVSPNEADNARRMLRKRGIPGYSGGGSWEDTNRYNDMLHERGYPETAGRFWSNQATDRWRSRSFRGAMPSSDYINLVHNTKGGPLTVGDPAAYVYAVRTRSGQRFNPDWGLNAGQGSASDARGPSAGSHGPEDDMVSKLKRMATQSVSPNEAAVASAMLRKRGVAGFSGGGGYMSAPARYWAAGKYPALAKHPGAILVNERGPEDMLTASGRMMAIKGGPQVIVPSEPGMILSNHTRHLPLSERIMQMQHKAGGGFVAAAGGLNRAGPSVSAMTQQALNITSPSPSSPMPVTVVSASSQFTKIFTQAAFPPGVGPGPGPGPGPRFGPTPRLGPSGRISPILASSMARMTPDIGSNALHGDIAARIGDALNLTPARAISVAFGQIAAETLGGRGTLRRRARFATQDLSDAQSRTRQREGLEASYAGARATVAEKSDDLRSLMLGTSTNAKMIKAGTAPKEVMTAFSKLQQASKRASGLGMSLNAAGTAEEQANIQAYVSAHGEKAARGMFPAKPVQDAVDALKADPRRSGMNATGGVLQRGDIVKSVGVGSVAMLGTSIAFSAVMTGVNAGLELLGQAATEQADALTGFGAVTRRVTGEMSQGMQGRGNLSPSVMASQLSALGLSTGMMPNLTQAATNQASAEQYVKVSDALRAEQNLPNDQWKGILTGMGNGLFGTPVNETPAMAARFNDTVKLMGAPQTIGMQGRDLTHVSQDQLQFQGVPFFGDLSKIMAGLENSGLFASESDPTGTRGIPGVRQETPDEIAARIRSSPTVTNMMDAAKRGGFTGDVTMGASGPALASSIEALKGLGPVVGELPDRFKEMGIAVSGGTAAWKKFLEAWAKGENMPDIQGAVDAMKPQLTAQIRDIGRQTAFNNTTAIPASFATRMAASPLSKDASQGLFVPGAGGGAGQRAFAMYGDQIRATRKEITAFQAEGMKALENLGVPKQAITDVQTLGTDIKTLNDKAANLQIGLEQESWNRQMFVSKRSLGDIIGLQGKQSVAVSGMNIQATKYGKLQREQLLLERENSRVALARNRRELEFQIALSRINTPGATPEERATRAREADLRAQETASQLNRDKKGRDIGIQLQDIGITREASDAIWTLSHAVKERNISFEIKGIQQVVEGKQLMLDVKMQFLDSWKSAGESIKKAGNAAIAAAEAATGDFSGAVGKAVDAALNGTGKSAGLVGQFKAGYDDLLKYVTANPLVPSLTTTATGAATGATGGTGGKGHNGNRSTGAFASGLLTTVSGASDMTVGEAGKETVAVLRNPRAMMMRGMGGGGSIINLGGIVINGNVDSDQRVQQIAEAVERRLHQRAALVGAMFDG